MDRNGKKFESANETLRRAWRESIWSRLRELEERANAIRDQLLELRDLIQNLEHEESDDESSDP